MLSPGDAAPPALLETPVFRSDGSPSTLAELIAGRPALVLLLRHFGCTGCSQQVDALAPYLHKLAGLGLAVVLCGNGRHEHLEAFIERQRLRGYPVACASLPIVNDPWEVLRAAGVPSGAVRPGPTRFDPDALREALGIVTTGELSELDGACLCAWLAALGHHWPSRFEAVAGENGRALLARLRATADDGRVIKLRRIAVSNLARVL